MRYITLFLCLAVVIWYPENSLAQRVNGVCTVNGTVADCSHSKLTNIPSSLPANITCLNMLGNSLSNITGRPWQRYKHLKKLSLARNRITALHKGNFDGLQKLEMLDLSLNLIRYTSIHKDVFKPLRSLVFLDIKQNLSGISVSEYYPEGLKNLIHLKTLVIDGLGTQALPHLPNLIELYMSGEYGRCYIPHINGNFFENITTVQNIFLSNCSIKKVDFNSFMALHNITSLDMSDNINLGMESLPNITSGLARKQRLKRLNLNDLYDHSQFDFCSSLNYDDVKYLSNSSIEMVTIENNNIVRMDVKSVEHWPKSIKYISIQHNMFLYGNYTPFLILTDVLNRTVYLDASRMAAANRPIYSSEDAMKMVLLKSNMQQHGTESVCRLMFTRYQVGDYFQFIENRLKQNDINTDTSKNLEPKLEYLDLSENLPVLIERIFEIFPHIPNLKVLNVSRNYLGYPLYDGPSIIGQLKHLRTLDLSDNKIIRLSPNIFNNLTKLEKLYLSHNKISNITFDLSHSKNLHYIDLGYNNLESINQATRDTLDNISKNHKLNHVHVNIANNSLKCTCENLLFYSWVKKNTTYIVNKDNTNCTFKNSTSVSLSTLIKNYDHFERECSNYLVIILVTSIAFIFIIVIITSALMYRFRWNLRYMYYMTKLKLLANYQRLNDTEYEKEVFVSYADEDRRFVAEKVRLELEERGEISLLIHDRDFRAGAFVQDNILRAISCTRRTLVILTKQFLKSKWCMYEFNMARMEAADTGRNVLCFILKEDIPTTELPVEMIDALKKITYIEYPTADDDLSQFWDRLRATLKHET
ncbi:toll-like receptor 4 isoform X2 [Ruditapes philippinarum]|uniref:toll-like receptor 4 isoform X1 n=1 Tax=Ruditapes philippinarum TaxID=129788 RepID=UPI00295C0D49|nr:toll-like receptor 4 isoform X1 [Ruditapes philippinarum]XP_060564893.1 toll-like receptor 4 isoform X2 [Ruditapes philippinarum]